MLYVEITKSGVSTDPVTPPGHPDTYPYGRRATTSLPMGYWLRGWMMGSCAIGQPVQVLRMIRNGERKLGLFVSTPVTTIGPHEFTTRNSRYTWRPHEETVWPQLHDLPEEERVPFQSYLGGDAQPSALVPLEGGFHFQPADYWSWKSGRA